MRTLEICVDFDGTCVTHEYPKTGRDVGAVPVLKDLVKKGHKLILWTMRSNTAEGNFLDHAVAWFKSNEIPLYGIQVNPTQHEWTTSRKAYGQLYIDDAALGCPLKQNYLPHPDGHYSGEPVPVGRPYVDWEAVRKFLQEKGLL